MSFEDDVLQVLKQKIISEVKSTDLLKTDYNRRQSIPTHILDELWDSIDWKEIVSIVKPELEKRICNSIIAGMETETKTDIKKLLSIDGVRQKLRVEVYPKLMQVLNDEV